MKADLTQTEAINIIKKYENDKFESKDYSFELQPYQSRGENIVKVKNNKGKLVYTYRINTRLNLYIKQTLTTTTFHQESMKEFNC